MFNQRTKLTALCICHIFETSSALGNASTVAVLNDGAGISYGIPQATHKSGNLHDVIERYIEQGNVLHKSYLREILPQLVATSNSRHITKMANNAELKRILKELGKTDAMRKAQLANINSRLNKAVRACIGSGFNSALSLAVIYDSMNHGSWEKIRDRVKLQRNRFSNNQQFEVAWITEYVEERHRWLNSIKRLASTSYRTAFFKTQIENSNWNLKLPIKVHGYFLQDKDINQAEKETTFSSDYVKDQQTTPVETDKDETIEPVSTVVDAVTSDDVPKTQVIEAETTNEQTGETTSVKAETEILPQAEVVVIEKERPSFAVKLQSAIAYILAGGGAVYGAIKGFFDQIDQIPTINVIIFSLTILGLAYIAYKIYSDSADRANKLNMEKLNAAKCLTSNTVEFARKPQKDSIQSLNL